MQTHSQVRVGLGVLKPYDCDKVSFELMKTWFDRKSRVKQLSIGVAAGFLGMARLPAQTVLVESWENSLDGWQEVIGNTLGLSTTTGVTAGSYSLAVSRPFPGAGDFFLLGPSSIENTELLAGAGSLSLDIYAPPGTFGGYIQFDVSVFNSDFGEPSIDGNLHQMVLPGTETTLNFSMSPAIAAELSASSSPTRIIIQAFFPDSATGDTVYLDNLTVTIVPEPSVAAMLVVGLIGFTAAKHRRAIRPCGVDARE